MSKRKYDEHSTCEDVPGRLTLSSINRKIILTWSLSHIQQWGEEQNYLQRDVMNVWF